MPSARWYIHLLSYTSKFLTVFGPPGRTVVSCGYDMLIPDYDSSHPSPKTSGSLGDKESHLHKIFIIIRSIHGTKNAQLCYISLVPCTDNGRGYHRHHENRGGVIHHIHVGLRCIVLVFRDEQTFNSNQVLVPTDLSVSKTNKSTANVTVKVYNDVDDRTYEQ